MKTVISWWDAFAIFPPFQSDRMYESKEQRRRSLLISRYLLLCFLLEIFSSGFALLPGSIVEPVVWLQSIGISAPFFVVALLANRRGHILFAGILCVFSSLLAVTVPFITGIGLADLPGLSLLITPLIISCAILPPEWVFAQFGLNLALITFALLSPFNALTLQMYVRQNTFSAFMPEVSVQLCVTVITYLIVKNLIQAMRRAERAEEVARFRRAVVAQEHALAEQKEQFEHAIHLIMKMKQQGTLPSSLSPLILGSSEAWMNREGEPPSFQEKKTNGLNT